MTDTTATNWPEEQPMPLDHLRAPDAIRRVVAGFANPAGNMHRVPADRNDE